MKTVETGSYLNGVVEGLIMNIIALFILSCNIKYIYLQDSNFDFISIAITFPIEQPGVVSVMMIFTSEFPDEFSEILIL